MKKIIIFSTIIGVVLLIGGFLLYHGYIWFNNPSLEEYPVQGLDVSHHQKEIDWPSVGQSVYQFVFIKATEGEDFRDKRFQENWRNSKEAGLIRGAYHFFTFGAKGVEQAQNFINVVPQEAGVMPPVIDLEFAGNSKKIPERDYLQRQLQDFITLVEAHYGQKPIFYVTYAAYKKYLQGDFTEYHIWIRDVFKSPKLPAGREWLFWQYNDRGRIEGVEGPVDKNVFNGDASELQLLLKWQSQ